MTAHIARTRTMKLIGVSALVGSLFAALTGCAAAEPNAPIPGALDQKSAAPAAASVYEFKTPAYGAKNALTIQVPQDLIDVAPEAKELLVTSVAATDHPLSSAKYCAVDFAVTYADRGIEELAKPFLSENDPQSAEDMSLAAVQANGANSIEELQAKFDKEYQAKLDAPTWSNTAANLTGPQSETRLIGDLDQSNPEPGIYMADDSKNVVFVQKCAESPMDGSDSSTSEFRFPHLADSNPATFASMDFSVMKDGTLTIIERTIKGYKLDSSGSWLAE